MEFIFNEEFSAEIKSDISGWISHQLNDILGEADSTLITYITTMIENKKTVTEMKADLIDFLAEGTNDFVQG